MSKQPPPPLKPKPKLPPKITAKKPVLVAQNTTSIDNPDSITKDHITLTALDDSDSDAEAATVDDSKLAGSHSLASASKFPPPPVRRNLPPPVASTAGTITAAGTTAGTTTIIGTGKKQMPPPVARQLPPRHKSPNLDDVPNLQRPVSHHRVPSEEEQAPALPTRPPVRKPVEPVEPADPVESEKPARHVETEDRPSFLSPKKPSRLDSKRFPGDSDDEDDASGESEVAPPLPMRRNIPIRRKSRQSSYSMDSDEDRSDSEEESKPSSLRSHSSLLFDSAKKYSKSGYHAAKDKSTPYAKQAKSSIGKWKEKISNSTSSLPDANHADDDSEFNEDDYYKTRRERAKSIKSQTGPSPEPEKHQRQNQETNGNATRTLPINGRPLPGMVENTKPPIPKKTKPAVPPKKHPQQDNSQHEVPAQRLVTPPSVTPRSIPPVTPPARQTPNQGKSVPPPAPPTRTRPPVAPPSRNTAAIVTTPKWTEPDLDLELPSLWFTSADMMQLPKCFQGLNCQLSAGFIGDKQFRSYAFRGVDLSTIKLKLIWKKDSPSPLDSLTQELKFIPPPTASKEMLVQGHKVFGEHVASWCEVKSGQQVGNGECWTLAHDALQKGCGKHAFVSSALIHGALLYTVKANGDKPEVIVPNVTDDIKRGDILQFKSCFFKYPTMTMTYGAPDHTAIVLDVKEGTHGGSFLKNLKIIQQNMSGVKIVAETELDLGRLKGGDVKVFRPVEKEWVVDLMDVLM